MSTPGNPPTDPTPHVGHETRDVHIGGLLWLAAGIIVSAVVIHALLWFLLEYFREQARQADPIVSPLAAEKQVPPEPRLQNTPLRDYEKFRQEQVERLSGYGWVDRQQGVVHIPISRAIDLLAERGLPTPEGPVTPAGQEGGNRQTPTDAENMR